MSVDAMEERLLTLTLETFRAEYAELSDAWKTLDQKAQGNVAICGIFFAGTIAFIKDGIHISWFGRITLLWAVFCLILSVLRSLNTLSPRVVPAPPVGEPLVNLLAAATKEREFSSADLVKFLTEQANHWRPVNTAMRTAILEKADLVRQSNASLFSAVMLYLIIVIWKIFS